MLAAVDTTGLSDQQVMDWAVPRAANQFWMLSEPERATAFLNNVRRRVITPSARITLDALSATFAMNAGNAPCRSRGRAGTGPSRRPGHGGGMGRQRGGALLGPHGSFLPRSPPGGSCAVVGIPGLLRFTVGLAETTTLLMAGQIQTAYETAQLFTDFAELAQPGRAIGEVLLAQVLLARGEAAAAEELLRPASATLERTGYSWGPLALTLLATALGYQGNVPESAKALARAQARHGTKSAMFAPELGVARAWRLATIDDRPGAITAARDAARMAQRSGQNAIAVRAWHEAARLGDRRAAAGLAQIIDAVDCAYTRMAMEHASALAAGDAAGLAAAAEQLAAAGFNGAAEDARTQAEMVG